MSGRNQGWYSLFLFIPLGIVAIFAAYLIGQHGNVSWINNVVNGMSWINISNPTKVWIILVLVFFGVAINAVVIVDKFSRWIEWIFRNQKR